MVLVGPGGEILSRIHEKPPFWGSTNTWILNRRAQSPHIFLTQMSEVGAAASMVWELPVLLPFVWSQVSSPVLPSVAGGSNEHSACCLVLLQLIFYVADLFPIWNQFLLNLCSKVKALSLTIKVTLGDLLSFSQPHFLHR